MPIRGDALKVKKAMQEKYGDKWEEVFYATANKQGRNPETWKIRGKKTVGESLTIEEALLGRIAATILTEGEASSSMVVRSACASLISEAASKLSPRQQQEFGIVANIFEEFYSHNKAQIKAAQAIVNEPGIQKWGARTFPDWKTGGVVGQTTKLLGSFSRESMAKAREAIDSASGASQKIPEAGKPKPMNYEVDDRKAVNDHIARIFRDDILNRSELL